MTSAHTQRELVPLPLAMLVAAAVATAVVAIVNLSIGNVRQSAIEQGIAACTIADSTECVARLELREPRCWEKANATQWKVAPAYRQCLGVSR